MSEQPSFADLIRRVRARDESAAAELVRRYEPAIRRTVHFRLPKGRLQGLLEPEDVCQIVWTHFFARLTAGGLKLHQPRQLFRLLGLMARNHLVKETRRLCATRRGGAARWLDRLPPSACLDPRPDPSQQAMRDELRQRARRLLSAEEWQLMEHRAWGRTWPEIAAACGGRADALRMRLARACRRVHDEIGLTGS